MVSGNIFVMPPPVALTFSEYVPLATVAPTVAVRAADPTPGAAILLGENFIVTPAGVPEAVKLTTESKVALRPVVIVVVPLDPAVTVMALVASVAVSVGALTTVKLSVAVCGAVPLLPVTVMV